jgi:hypothetical protein
MNTRSIDQIIKNVDLSKPASISEAASLLLTEDNFVKAGQTCAVIDDPTFPLAGATVKVKKVDGGFADCEAANGTPYRLQTSLLLPQ